MVLMQCSWLGEQFMPLELKKRWLFRWKHGFNFIHHIFVNLHASPAPCDPANVTASLNCLSEVATVTWSASTGANFYTAVAQAGGLVDSCNSTGTLCELSKLQCGENYTVTVLAGDAKCNSSILAKTNIVTGENTAKTQSLTKSFCPVSSINILAHIK